MYIILSICAVENFPIHTDYLCTTHIYRPSNVNGAECEVSTEPSKYLILVVLTRIMRN